MILFFLLFLLNVKSFPIGSDEKYNDIKKLIDKAGSTLTTTKEWTQYLKENNWTVRQRGERRIRTPSEPVTKNYSIPRIGDCIPTFIDIFVKNACIKGYTTDWSKIHCHQVKHGEAKQHLIAFFENGLVNMDLELLLHKDVVRDVDSSYPIRMHVDDCKTVTTSISYYEKRWAVGTLLKISSNSTEKLLIVPSVKVYVVTSCTELQEESPRMALITCPEVKQNHGEEMEANSAMKTAIHSIAIVSIPTILLILVVLRHCLQPGRNYSLVPTNEEQAEAGAEETELLITSSEAFEETEDESSEEIEETPNESTIQSTSSDLGTNLRKRKITSSYSDERAFTENLQKTVYTVKFVVEEVHLKLERLIWESGVVSHDTQSKEDFERIARKFSVTFSFTYDVIQSRYLKHNQLFRSIIHSDGNDFSAVNSALDNLFKAAIYLLHLSIKTLDVRSKIQLMQVPLSYMSKDSAAPAVRHWESISSDCQKHLEAFPDKKLAEHLSLIESTIDELKSILQYR